MTIPIPPDLPEPVVHALAWVGDASAGTLRLLDQTRLPAEEIWLARDDDADVVEDIHRLAVRGAPALGLAGAYGIVLAARRTLARDEGWDAFQRRVQALTDARPTAVNLAAATKRVLAEAGTGPLDDAFVHRCLDAAQRLERREHDACARIAEAGAAWLGDRRRFLTHCNAGALVTPGLGTALAPMYLLHARGANLHVWVDETRPLLQGLRLTAWELARAGISHQVLVEGAAPSLMRRGEVDAVLVGADRVARNGDVANKIGTYGVALAARHHHVPFLVLAPLSTLDPGTPSGDEIRIENRPADGLRYLQEGLAGSSEAWGPAFDVTPAGLVSALVTDEGVLEAPTLASLTPWMDAASRLQQGGATGR